MTPEEYNELFFALGMNRVAFKTLHECEAEILNMINVALTKDRESRNLLTRLSAHQRFPNS